MHNPTKRLSELPTRHRSLPPAEAARLEREYVEHRESVLAMLRSEYPRLDDAEELYQEAWADLLEQRSRGFQATRVRGLLKTIAWRRARDRLRKKRPDSVDPSSPAMALAADPAEPPEVQAHCRRTSCAFGEPPFASQSSGSGSAAARKLARSSWLSAENGTAKSSGNYGATGPARYGSRPPTSRLSAPTFERA